MNRRSFLAGFTLGAAGLLVPKSYFFIRGNPLWYDPNALQILREVFLLDRYSREVVKMRIFARAPGGKYHLIHETDGHEYPGGKLPVVLLDNLCDLPWVKA